MSQFSALRVALHICWKPECVKDLTNIMSALSFHIWSLLSFCIHMKFHKKYQIYQLFFTDFLFWDSDKKLAKNCTFPSSSKNNCGEKEKGKGHLVQHQGDDHDKGMSKRFPRTSNVKITNIILFFLINQALVDPSIVNF